MTPTRPEPVRTPCTGHGGWPSGRRLTRPGSTRRLLHPEDHSSLEDIALHPELCHLAAQLRQLGAVVAGQPLGLTPFDPVPGNPIPQRALMNSQVTGDLGDRLPGLLHDP